MTYIQVKDTNRALAFVASNYYGNPSKDLKLVGITGTNGKTTTATLLHDLFTQLGFYCGLLSTVVNKIGSQTIAATHTTPNPVALNALLREMVSAGCQYCFMEVSSHAIDQGRIGGLHFAAAGFTNIQPIDTKRLPGNENHEMGGVRMGKDPKTSVLNAFNQMHHCQNVFVTDGSCMTSTSTQNPSLTYMALTARAVDYAISEKKKRNL